MSGDSTRLYRQLLRSDESALDLWHAHDVVLAVGVAGTVLSILSGDMLLGLAVQVNNPPVAHIVTGVYEEFRGGL